MIFQIIATILLAILSGIFYRMGGSGNYPRWTRTVGVCSCMMALSFVWLSFHWTLLISFGLLFGALTTYWKPKGKDAKWYHWMFTGLGYSLSMLPFAIAYHLWWQFAVFTIVMTSLITVWSTLIGKDIIEEVGRGIIIILSMVILFISKLRKGKK